MTTSWVEFYRSIVGSDDYAANVEQLTHLRAIDQGKSTNDEPQQMITVRVPVSMHRALASECDRTNQSLNQLCITKLLQPTDPRFVPDFRGCRRGRRIQKNGGKTNEH